MSPEHHEHRKKRFARIRRAKWFLRYVPRRARFHRYPLIGRFADIARKRDYLWSFRTESVRPALYYGAILAFMPIMGIQVGIAFFVAILARANVMVMAALQFITTPVTFLFIYKGTYEVGRIALSTAGIGTRDESIGGDAAFTTKLMNILSSVTSPEAWGSMNWGEMIAALFTGGLIVGVMVGFVLDVIWRIASSQAEARKLRRAVEKLDSGSTRTGA